MDAVQDRMRETVQSLFLSDVEMGKKDDDHQRPKAGGVSAGLRGSALNSVRVHPRKFLKRLLIVFLVGAAVYLFIQNLPTDLGVRDHRRPVYYTADQARPGHPPMGQQQKQQQQVPHRPQAQPFSQRLGQPGSGRHEEGPPPIADPGAKGAASAAVGTYNGQLRFLELASSLRVITSTRGGYLLNKNVLFAAGSLKSMATLLPMACQMGAELRSYVHFAVMSKSDISLAELQQINGIDATCNIFFHDARPEYASISTDERMENSVDVAMSHIQLYMHPQAIIIDGSSTEEAFLKAGMRTYAKSSQTAIVELPPHGAQRLGWLTKLDSASLSNWNRISIDILIHAYPGASGSLIRLLKSLSSADFGGSSVPHVTIELPQKVDPPTEKFLESFQWPPRGFADPSGTRQLSLRHRIPKHGVSEEESSIRFLESFWPTHPQNSHVLVLSPQTELAQDFFHYVTYALLEYRYSNPALLQEWDKRLFGVSLDLPRMGLDGVTKFSPPPPLQKAAAAAAKASSPVSAAAAVAAAVSDDGQTPFLWQAPNSNAVLFLGERWVELHRFVARLLEAQHSTSSTGLSPAEQKFLTTKRVSKTFPSWMEHALRLCQARGFWTLYPSSFTASALATVHNELYKPPEEYEDEVLAEAEKRKKAAAAAAAGAETGGPSGPSSNGDDNTGEVRLGSNSLLEALPNGGSLAPFSELPLLAWDGKQVSLDDLNSQAIEYATDFRRTVGGCSEGMLDVLLPETLFCNDDDDD